MACRVCSCCAEQLAGRSACALCYPQYVEHHWVLLVKGGGGVTSDSQADQLEGCWLP